MQVIVREASPWTPPKAQTNNPHPQLRTTICTAPLQHSGCVSACARHLKCRTSWRWFSLCFCSSGSFDRVVSVNDSEAAAQGVKRVDTDKPFESLLQRTDSLWQTEEVHVLVGACSMQQVEQLLPQLQKWRCKLVLTLFTFVGSRFTLLVTFYPPGPTQQNTGSH